MKLLKKILTLLFALGIVFGGATVANAADAELLPNVTEESSYAVNVATSGKEMAPGEYVSLYVSIYNSGEEQLAFTKEDFLFDWSKAHEFGLNYDSTNDEIIQGNPAVNDGIVEPGEKKNIGYINLYFKESKSETDVTVAVDLIDVKNEINSTQVRLQLKNSHNCINPQELPGGGDPNFCEPTTPPLGDVQPTLPVVPDMEDCVGTQEKGGECDSDLWPTLPSNFLDFYDVNINKINVSTLEGPLPETPVLNKGDIVNYQVNVNRLNEGSQKIDASQAFVVDFGEAYDNGLRLVEDGQITDKHSIAFDAFADQDSNAFNLRFTLAEPPAEDVLTNIQVIRNDESKVYFEPAAANITLKAVVGGEDGGDNGGDNGDDNGTVLPGGQDSGDKSIVAGGGELANTGVDGFAGIIAAAGGLLTAAGGGVYGFNVLRRRRLNI